jgi:hypothetical protein
LKTPAGTTDRLSFDVPGHDRFGAQHDPRAGCGIDDLMLVVAADDA